MSWRSQRTSERYGSLAIGLHWLVALQLLAVYACINLADAFPEDSAPQTALMMWHFMLGLSVLVVALLRIINRLASVTPAALSSTPKWQRRLSATTHLALYALILAMPVLGWLTLSAQGEPIPFFGVELPPLIAPNHALAKELRQIHETLGVTGYYLIGLHVAAALVHHYAMHDSTLARMLPFLSSRATERESQP